MDNQFMEQEREFIMQLEKIPLNRFNVKFGRVLLDLVKNKKKDYIFYEDINNVFGNTLTIKVLSDNLGIFSKLCHDKLELPFISGNVVRKDTRLPRRWICR